MASVDDGMTRDELLDAAARAGHRLRAATLKRWHREFVPRPTQVHVPGEAGSTSVYPHGTLQQLLAVCRLHQVERRFDELRFDVWWEGFWVDPTRLRGTFKRVLDDPLEEIREIRRLHRDPYDTALALTEQAQTGSGRSPIARLLRHRAGSDEELLTALVPVFVVAFGGEPVWESHDAGLDEQEPHPRDLVTNLFGFGRAVNERLDSGEPWLLELPDVSLDLPRLKEVGLLELEYPSRTLCQASEGRLERARGYARALAVFSPLAQALEDRHGRDAGGFGIFSAAERRDARFFRAWLVRLCLLAPEVIPAEQIDEVSAALSATEAQINAAVAIGEEFPGYKQFLGPGGEQRLAKLPSEERNAIRTNLEEFLSRNPQFREALDTD